MRQFVPQRSRGKRIASVAGILIVGILFMLPVTRGGVTRVFAAIGTPFVRAGNAVGEWFSDTRGFVQSKRALVQENEVLKNQIRELSVASSERTMLRAKVAELQALLGRTDTISNLTLASILAKPPQSLYGTVLIDGGSAVGFSEGMSVYAYGSIPVGVIETVFDNRALVRLYWAPGVETVLRLSNGSDVTVIGRGNGNFAVTLPQGVEVNQDLSILTQTLTPRLVGTFVSIISDERDPVQVVLFKSPVNILELSYLEVSL